MGVTWGSHCQRWAQAAGSWRDEGARLPVRMYPQAPIPGGCEAPGGTNSSGTSGLCPQGREQLPQVAGEVDGHRSLFSAQSWKPQFSDL